MAHHKSAIKRIRTSEAARLRNRNNRSRMKTALKKWRDLIEEGKLEEAKLAFPKLMSHIMSLPAKGTLKKQTASRKISRLAVELQKAFASAQSQPTA
ncbi:MAG: 30S ribosomal protein S20 [Myxococcales bacterium]|nr:MAG: 30S ribosomal protein S20 [Myxococcales bacterium]